MKILHIISGLSQGGGERMLQSLVTGDQHRRHAVISLTDVGPVGRELEAAAVPVRAVHLAASRPQALWELARAVREEKPDLVHTWLYHGNAIGGTVARLVSPRTPVLWSVHNTEVHPSRNKRRTIAVVHAGARLSGAVPTRIHYCAESARRVHEALGYEPGRGLVIPNGFDTSRYRPDAEARARLRAELAVEERTPLVGLFARYNPQKDFPNFLAAFAHLRATRPEAVAVLVGSGTESENRELSRLVADAGLPESALRRLGFRRDMPALSAAIDVLALSSSGSEAFPLVLGEALACGVPCVSTDIGDAREIVAQDGRIVPPRDPEALARGLDELLGLPPDAREALGARGRERVLANWDLEAVVSRYGALYEALAGRQA